MTVSASSCHVTFTAPLGYIGGMIDIMFHKGDVHRAGEASAGPDPHWISPFEWATPCREEGVTQLSNSRAMKLQTPQKRICWTNKPRPTQRAYFFEAITIKNFCSVSFILWRITSLASPCGK